MNNRFVLRGQVVSYGTTKGNDWLLISTPDGKITVYLEDVSISDIECDLQGTPYVIITGYLTSYKYTDEVIAVATDVDVK